MTETTNSTETVQPEAKLVDNFPYGKRSEKQTGNNLFQDVICKPFEEARALMKDLGPRKLTPAQRKRKAKNRSKQKARR